MRSTFGRSARGISVRLSANEQDLLRALPGMLDEVGEPGGVDPAANRLRPTVHRDDATADAAYHDMIDGQIAAERRSDRAAFGESLNRRPLVLSQQEAETWLRVLGESRLVVAARMGIVDDYDWSDRRMAAGPNGAILQYLSYLQDRLVAALSRGLPGS